LAKEIRVLAESPRQLDQMEDASRKLAHGDAAASVVDMIEELSHKKAQSTLSTKH
jgi:UDP-N-acetylglucosamine:LPS N-acetylglucosamine transferase